MKKLFLIFAILFSTLTAFASEKITDWKNSEMGAKKNPSWLTPINKKFDFSKAKKQFNISSDEKLFFVIGFGDEIEYARTDAKLKLKTKILDELINELKVESSIVTDSKFENMTTILSGFEEVSNFWQEIESEGTVTYKYYQLNKIKISRWNILKLKLMTDLKEKLSEVKIQ